MRFLSDKSVVEKSGTGPRVMAAGLPRCATSSLQMAFEEYLGFSPCMHMARVAPHADRLRLCRAAAVETDKFKRQRMLREVFGDFDAISDLPGVMFVEDFMEMYPNCKFVLNKRKTGAAWRKSLMESIYWMIGAKSSYRWICYLVETDREHWRLEHALRKEILPARYGIFDWDDERLHEAHNQYVRDCAKRHQKEILEWEPSDGWDSLCMFLDKPIPDDPFPQTNDSAQMKTLKRVLIVRGLAYWTALLSLPAIGYGAARFLGTWRHFA